MDVAGVILRLVAVSAMAVLLSILAVATTKLLDVDLTDVSDRTRPKVLIVAALFNVLFILGVAMILRFWDDESLRTLGLSLDISGLLFSAVAMVIALCLAVVYAWLLHAGKVLRIRWNSEILRESDALARTLFAYVVLLIAATQEEVLFRGYFSFVLMPYGFWCALLISSVAFATWHLLTNKANMFQTTDWLLGGILLFFVYWLSGSIWIATLVHFSRNFTNVIVFNIADTGALISYEQPIAPSYKTAYTILYSTAIISFAWLYFR